MIEGFHRPATVAEALRLDATLGPGTFFLAGGTELNQLHYPHRIRHLVSVTGLGLGGVAAGRDGLVLGATSTVQELLEDGATPALLRRAAARIANRNVRNVATLGGHLAAGKTCADLIPALVALDARVLVATTSGSGAWSVPDYLDARPRGLIVAVQIPPAEPSRTFGLAGFKRTANSVSLVNAAAALTRVGGAVHGLVLALGGVGPTVLRMPGIEQALEGRPLLARSALEALIAPVARTIADLRGSAAFKRQLAATLAADAIEEAWAQGEG